MPPYMMWFHQDPSGGNGPHATQLIYCYWVHKSSQAPLLRTKLLHDVHKWRYDGLQMSVPIGVVGQISYKFS